MNTGNSSCRKTPWQGRFRGGWMATPGLMYVPGRYGKMPSTIMTGNRKNMRPMRYARSWTRRSSDGKEGVIIVSQKKVMAH